MFIEIKNAKKHYGEGEALIKALDDVSLSLDEGKICNIRAFRFRKKYTA
mgnify:CR=1 FL=1